jgi:ATP-dependent protease ClpP protease subunit
VIRFPILLAMLLSAPAQSATARPFAGFGTIGPVQEEVLAPAAAMLAKHPALAYLLIDSPGGSVSDGLDFVDQMLEAQAAGTHIVCTVKNRGMAASMAAYILAACDERYMGRQSAIMFHTISRPMVQGNQWELERAAKELESANARMALFIAGRLKIPIAVYLKNVHDRDWWIGWEEALAIGAIDGVSL